MGCHDELGEVSEALARFLRERDWEQFHDPKNLSMSIAIEAAELMELFQWQRSDAAAAEAAAPELRERVREELADVMLYCLSLARVLDIDPAAAMRDKLLSNSLKYPADRFRGVARKYTDAPARPPRKASSGEDPV